MVAKHSLIHAAKRMCTYQDGKSKAQLLSRNHDKAFHSIIQTGNVCMHQIKQAFLPLPLLQHQRQCILIITQQCPQSLLINSICYLSSPACCAWERGKNTHCRSIKNSISDGSHAAFVIHEGNGDK